RHRWRPRMPRPQWNDATKAWPKRYPARQGCVSFRSVFRASTSSIVLLLLLVIASCGGETPAPVFTLLSPGQTGVTFANTITTDDSFNIQSNVYVYNGAGVAAGDIDNDGLPDLFFRGKDRKSV